MSTKYEPIFARVLIEREIKDKSAGGIIIPNAKRHASCEGTIIALGETVTDKLKVGQRVLFGRYSGAWINASDNKDADDGTLFICQDEDILAIITEKAA